jgi:hypothetical protein
MHSQLELHEYPVPQTPQEPPQLSGPQSLLEQFGLQLSTGSFVHSQLELHEFPPHLPQEPPHPSSPQSLLEHFGWQVVGTH